VNSLSHDLGSVAHMVYGGGRGGYTASLAGVGVISGPWMSQWSSGAKKVTSVSAALCRQSCSSLGYCPSAVHVLYNCAQGG
jgi:hypothetical protein